MKRSTWCLVGLGLLLGCADGGSAEKKGKGTPVASPVGDAPPFKPLDETKTKTTKSGLKIEDVKLGEGAEANAGNIVQVHYTGWLTGGKKFDSSHEKARPITLILGTGEVIEGWDEGVAGMKEGGKRRLQIPPELGYRDRGKGDIPPGATLVYEIDLLKAKPGVKIEELKEGTGPAAKPGDRIAVHYTGKLENGKQFDSSVGKQPLAFRLGERGFIRGMSAGLVGLKVGGKRKLTIVPDLAYGEEGFRQTIPPHATIIFEVELVKIDK